MPKSLLIAAALVSLALVQPAHAWQIPNWSGTASGATPFGHPAGSPVHSSAQDAAQRQAVQQMKVANDQQMQQIQASQQQFRQQDERNEADCQTKAKAAATPDARRAVIKACHAQAMQLRDSARADIDAKRKQWQATGPAPSAQTK